MKPKDLQIPQEVDERLKEWARAFRDRRRLERCKSLEGRFNRFMPGARDEAWGDPGPPEAPLPPLLMPRVLRTHECVQSLQKSQKWAVTFGYCYPGLDRYRVLKALKKYVGRRFTWNAYLDELDIARVRVWACLSPNS